MSTISMIHGSGGVATADLIHDVFAREFGNLYLNTMNDSAIVPGGSDLAVTTDSFVVKPLFFRGGDIGRLAVAGTVNDLLTCGAVPEYITAGFILEEGLDTEDLKRIVHSMEETAKEAGVFVVSGDTKVVEGNGGLYINTAGIGFVPSGMRISPGMIEKGDAVLVTGTLGDHHAAILSSRMAIQNEIESDCAPLNSIVRSLINEGVPIHAIRDITRGGLATVLSELCGQGKKTVLLSEEKVPVHPAVKDFSGLLGLDPLYMGNEGKLVIILPELAAEEAIGIIKKSHYGENAVQIGKVLSYDEEEELELLPDSGELFVRTSIGGIRRLTALLGEGLPRIC